MKNRWNQIRAPKRHRAHIGGPIEMLGGSSGMKNSFEEEEGCENCNQEDEERKEGEAFENSISRLVLSAKDKDPHLFDVESSNEAVEN